MLAAPNKNEYLVLFIRKEKKSYTFICEEEKENVQLEILWFHGK